MSKTDKTKPTDIKVAEDAVAFHDHSRGDCDLPTLAEWLKIPSRKRWRSRCTWEARNWHKVKFSRTAGEKDWLAQNRKNKYPDWKAS